MAKHTPGPWTTDAVMSEALHDVILAYDVPGGGRPIVLASVNCDDEENTPRRKGDISPVEAEANARLMAAAPDLLAACEAAALACTKPNSELCRMLNAAIAKAVRN